MIVLPMRATHPCPRQSLTLTVVDRGSPRTRDPVHQRRWTRLLTAGVVSALLGSVVLGAIPVLFGSPLPMVYVYWRGIGTSERVAIEQQFRLSESTRVSEKAWSYVPLDTSPNTLRAIVTHPSIEDTDGINRRAFRLDRSPLTPRRGGWLEDAPPWMARAARFLAYALASLAAIFLLCSGVTSPLFGPESAIRRRISAQIHNPSSRLRALPSAVRARLQRGVTARSAEIVTVASVFVATVVWRFLTFTGFTNDHYAHLALAQQMLLGEPPDSRFLRSRLAADLSTDSGRMAACW